MRQVKCQITGEWGTSDTFVKIKDKYYKSQEIYDKEQHRKDIHKQLIDFVCYKLLDYQKGQKFPTSLTKKLKELSFYDDEVVLKTVQDYENDIVFWLNKKGIDKEYGKISYIFAIINSHINDVYNQWKREKLTQEKNSQINQDTNIDIDINKIETKHKEKDLSAWLEDDDI